MTENATNDRADVVIDMALVRAEVAAEVRARRASGVYPAGFERDLDALFDRFAPRPVTDNLEDALERSEDAAGIDPEIPIASNNAAFGAVKKVSGSASSTVTVGSHGARFPTIGRSANRPTSTGVDWRRFGASSRAAGSSSMFPRR